MLTFLLLSLAADPVGYAKPELLIEAEAVHKSRGQYHLLDVRPAKLYAEGHIPDSALVDLTKWGKALTAEKADEAFWKSELQAVGVTPDKPVVVIGSDMREVCRGWWLLKYAGVVNVKILNGGIDAFTKAGGAVTTDVTKIDTKAYDWKRDTKRFASKTDLIVSVDDKLAQIVDARSKGEFSGIQAMSKKGGHVPGAAHLEWSEYLDAKTGKFKTAAELKELIASKKIDLTKTCTTYCQSGGRASVAAFALELMGAKEVKNYYRSWSEWGNAEDTPIEK